MISREKAAMLETILDDNTEWVLEQVNDSRPHQFLHVCLWVGEYPSVIFSDRVFVEWGKLCRTVPDVEIVAKTSRLPLIVEATHLKMMFANTVVGSL